MGWRNGERECGDFEEKTRTLITHHFFDLASGIDKIIKKANLWKRETVQDGEEQIMAEDRFPVSVSMVSCLNLVLMTFSPKCCPENPTLRFAPSQPFMSSEGRAELQIFALKEFDMRRWCLPLWQV